MPCLDKQTNDSAHHLFLKRAITANNIDTATGNSYLSEQTVEEPA